MLNYGGCDVERRVMGYSRLRIYQKDSFSSSMLER